MDPTQAGFLAWVRAIMGVPTSALPDDSQAIYWAFTTALAIVNPQLQLAGALVPGGPVSYQRAVYNLAGDNLINWAQDQAGQTYFADARKAFGCNQFVPGFYVAASDEGTSGSLMDLESLKSLTLSQLQNTKTPYGRAYLGIAQSVGTLWGLT
jgi:hypothetical protein